MRKVDADQFLADVVNHSLAIYVQRIGRALRQPTTESRIRREVADMLLAEYSYWRAVEDESIAQFAMGAMGGCANVMAAVIMGKSAAEYRLSIEQRDKKLTNR